MSRRDPLRASLYLKRRWSRALPVGLLIALVTALLVVLIAPTNTFYETTRRNIAPLDAFTVVAPARRAAFDDSLRALLARGPGLERAVPVRVLWVRHPMLVGEAFCAFLQMDAGEVEPLMRRLGLSLAAGRMPKPGEVLLHEDVARARGLGVGDRFGSVVDPDDTTPGAHRVAGLLEGVPRIALGVRSEDVLSAAVLARAGAYQVVLPRSGAKDSLDAYLRAARLDGTTAFEVIDAAAMQRRMEHALQNLPVMIGFLSLASALVAAMVVALLTVIAFQSRVTEFAVLLAIGQTPGRLRGKLVAECARIALAGWALGLLLGYGGVVAYAHFGLEPRGLIMRLWDLRPVWASALVPLVSVLVAGASLATSLRRVDPIAVVQRRAG